MKTTLDVTLLGVEFRLRCPLTNKESRTVSTLLRDANGLLESATDNEIDVLSEEGERLRSLYADVVKSVVYGEDWPLLSAWVKEASLMSLRSAAYSMLARIAEVEVAVIVADTGFPKAE